MYKRTLLGLGLTVLLGLSTVTVQAADKKENLPKKVESDQKTLEKAPAKSGKTTSSKGGSDRFIDNNQNGVNDKGESKVRRPPTRKTATTIKTKPPKTTTESKTKPPKTTTRSKTKPKTPPSRW